MRAFADLLETVTPAASTTAARNLTDKATVKVALKITDTNSDALIDSLIPRVTQLIVNNCRLAQDASGGQPTFASEILRATWFVVGGLRQDRLLSTERGHDLYLPWRTPMVTAIDSVVEDGTALAASDDYIHLGAGRLMRVSSDVPIHWSTGKVVVVYRAGWPATPTSLATNIDAAIQAAAIEQIKYMLFGADRDPAIRLENVFDIARRDYSVPGGDSMGADVLLPQVRDMLADYRKALA